MALKVLSAGEELVLANVVKELRMNRHGSVQTEVQFIYMHRTLLSLAENKGVVKSSEVERFAHEYEFFINGRSFWEKGAENKNKEHVKEHFVGQVNLPKLT